jgi:hypothetical protein
MKKKRKKKQTKIVATLRMHPIVINGETHASLEDARSKQLTKEQDVRK